MNGKSWLHLKMKQCGGQSHTAHGQLGWGSPSSSSPLLPHVHVSPALLCIHALPFSSHLNRQLLIHCSLLICHFMYYVYCVSKALLLPQGHSRWKIKRLLQYSLQVHRRRSGRYEANSYIKSLLNMGIDTSVMRKILPSGFQGICENENYKGVLTQNFKTNSMFFFVS